MTKWTKEYDNDTGPYDDYFKEWWNVTDGNRTYRCNNSDDADFLIAALAQPEQKPVAWMTISPFGDEDDIWYANPEGQLREGWTYKALYEEPPKQNPLTSIDYVPCCTDQTCPKCKATTPPQRTWVGLTYKEVQEIHDTYHKRMGPQEFASMIEAKLKEKNGG